VSGEGRDGKGFGDGDGDGDGNGNGNGDGNGNSVIPIVGAGAVSAFGVGWRGLGEALRAGALQLTPSAELAASHPGALSSEVAPLAPALDAGDARSRKLMSRAARLSAIAMREALRDAAFSDKRDLIGAYIGVGASGASMQDVPAILSASLEGGALSLSLLGAQGIAACNPLFTFQTLNNFTLCHGAILEGLGGPNGAFFSRGAGTALALLEAMHALREGDCDRALAGGADTAVHPVTWAELKRDGWAAQGLQPAEGAAVLALAREAERSLALIESCAVRAGRRGLAAALDTLALPSLDIVLVAPWGAPARDALSGYIAARYPNIELLDLSLALGEALAAAPALAWVAALDLIAGESKRALVLSAGIDGDLAAVVLRGVPA
jgi:hypothetical protein